MMFAVRARNPQDGGRAEAAAAAAALRFLSRRLVSAPLSVRSCGHSVRRTTSGTLIDATAVTRATHRPGAAEALSVYPQTWQIGSHTTTATATVLREGHDRPAPDWPHPCDCSLHTPRPSAWLVSASTLPFRQSPTKSCPVRVCTEAGAGPCRREAARLPAVGGQQSAAGSRRALTPCAREPPDSGVIPSGSHETGGGRRAPLTAGSGDLHARRAWRVWRGEPWRVTERERTAS